MPDTPTGQLIRLHRIDQVDRDYKTLRIDMQTLLHDLGITIAAAAE